MILKSLQGENYPAIQKEKKKIWFLLQNSAFSTSKAYLYVYFWECLDRQFENVAWSILHSFIYFAYLCLRWTNSIEYLTQKLI